MQTNIFTAITKNKLQPVRIQHSIKTKSTQMKPQQQPKQQQSQQQSTTNHPVDSHQSKQIQDSIMLQLHFGFEVPTNFILDLFEQVGTMMGFQMIERQATHGTAIKQAKKTLLQMLDCFSIISQANMTAIKLTIHTNQKTSKRVCRIRGLVGSRKQVKLFLLQFKSRSRQLIKMQNSFYPQQQQQSSDNLHNPFHLEACAIYMFHKILSNQQYGIGAILRNSMSNYKNRFANVQVAVKELPLPMCNVVAIIQEIIDNLYKDFNYGKKEMEKVMPYCRVSVEKYVFTQVEGILQPVYHCAWSQMDSTFQEKRKRIFSTKSLALILEQIGLPRDLWFVSKAIQPTQIRQLHQWKPHLKYTQPSRQLQKLSHSKTPRQKLKQCQICYTQLKTIFYEQTNHKRQLINMEEIIPVLIVVILFTEMSTLKAELQMTLDWIEADPGEMEAERRLLVNLTESMNFIYRDWKV